MFPLAPYLPISNHPPHENCREPLYSHYTHFLARGKEAKNLGLSNLGPFSYMRQVFRGYWLYLPHHLFNRKIFIIDEF